ncbi:MAG: putative peptidoglycan glycosyltransferase FtsW [Verrucomicrobiota bacterium]
MIGATSMREKGRRVPRALMYVVLALVTLGLVVLASASSVRGEVTAGDPGYFWKKQMAWLGVGLPAGWLASLVDYRRWRKLARPLMLITLLLLLLVLLFGPRIGGSRRWLHAGGFSVQPTELAKFAAVAFLAERMSRVPLRAERLKEGLLGPGVGMGLMILLIMLEPDVGASLLIGAVGWTVLLVSGARLLYLLGGGLAGVAAIGAYIRLNPVRWGRIEAWLWPDQHPDIAYHFLEARNAFVLGGAGINPGGSMQKHFYLPEAHTDFIFAILGEEFGVWGSLGVVMLFVAFLVCGILISLRVHDRFGRLLAFGLTMTITLQALIHVAVVTGAVPTKGITLPFFSYGGSSLVMALLQAGILLNIGGGVGPRAGAAEDFAGDRIHRL